jgi:hypothetical protein
MIRIKPKTQLFHATLATALLAMFYTGCGTTPVTTMPAQVRLPDQQPSPTPAPSSSPSPIAFRPAYSIIPDSEIVLPNDLGRLYQDSASEGCFWLWVPAVLTEKDLWENGHSYSEFPGVPRSRGSNYYMDFSYRLSPEVLAQGRSRFAASVARRPSVDGARNPCQGISPEDMELRVAPIEQVTLLGPKAIQGGRPSAKIRPLNESDSLIDISVVADALDPAAEPATLHALSSPETSPQFELTVAVKAWRANGNGQTVELPLAIRPSSGKAFYDADQASAIEAALAPSDLWKCARQSIDPQPAPNQAGSPRSAPESCIAQTPNPGDRK